MAYIVSSTLNGPRRNALSSILVPRLAGPGGLYNLGNVVGLSMGLGLQLSHSSGATADTVLSHFSGSPEALCMTLANCVFMASGEVYHRAWANGFPPSAQLLWWGDFLSGVGALILAVALFLLGQPWLAATAGLLHAWGKFGSALHKSDDTAVFDWPMLFRRLVLASRVPAIIATGFEFGIAAAQGSIAAMLAPATLLFCYLLWSQADILLMDK